MKAIVLILLAFILTTISGCKKNNFRIDNINNGKIACMGHGGMGVRYTYPIDSYESVMNCMNMETDGTEFDLRLTKDSVLILFHDEELDYMTNLSGTIESKNWSEIKLGYYNQYPHIYYTIASLEDILKSVKNPKNKEFSFDCKLNNNIYSNLHLEKFANALIKLTDKYGISETVNIESDNELFLKALKNKKPAYKLFVNSKTFDEALDVVTKNNFYGITISNKTITKDQVEIAHSKNIRIAIWGVGTSSDNKKAIRKNPDYIQTDDVKNLVNLLK